MNISGNDRYTKLIFNEHIQYVVNIFSAVGCCGIKISDNI